MDSLELYQMWKSQELFNRNFVDFENLTLEGKQNMTKEYALHLFSEANSLLDTINWKMHHKKDSLRVNRDDLVLEIVDVWKYLLSICLLWDVTPEEFCRVYHEKTSLVEQRYLQEFAKTDGRKIAICDIDGVLGDYPSTFLEYVKSKELGHHKQFSSEEIKMFDNGAVSDIDLYRYLRGVVSQDTLKEYKHLYRSYGLTREELVEEGAREFLDSLRKRGYYIVLLTSRPFDKYKSLYLDTFIWLTQHNLTFDMLVNDSKKRDKVSELLKSSQVEFIVDDDPRLISGLESLENLKKIYILDKPYNRNLIESSKMIRVSKLSEIIKKECED